VLSVFSVVSLFVHERANNGEHGEHGEERKRRKQGKRKTEDGPDPVNQDQSLGRARNDRRARGS